MYFFIYQILFYLFNPQFYLNIEQKNLYISDFNTYMKQGNFARAVQVFEKLEPIHGVIDNHLRIDAAHAYFELGDTSKARINYEFSKDVINDQQAAIARNQLGLLALARKDSALAISYFKSAIERDKELKEAKYNFELISLQYRPPVPPPAQNEEQNEQVIQSDDKEKELEKYQPEHISKERAMQLLENLRMSEGKGSISRKNSNQKIEKDW